MTMHEPSRPFIPGPDPILLAVIDAMEALFHQEGHSLAIFRYQHYPFFKTIADKAVSQIKAHNNPPHQWENRLRELIAECDKKLEQFGRNPKTSLIRAQLDCALSTYNDMT